MPKWTKSPSSITKIVILLFDGFSNHCLANALEPFRAANTVSGRTFYQWQLLSLEGGLVRSSSGMLVETEAASVLEPPFDYLMVISSYGHQELSNSKILSRLRGLASHAACVVGLDTGAWLLAASGLLEDKQATIHGDVFDSFSETFANTDAKKERFIIDGNYITCGGAMASFDLVLKLIGDQYGETIRLDVAALFMHGTNQPFRIGDGVSIRSKTVSRALVLMDQNLEEPLSIDEIAHHLECSPKSLQRQFIQILDTTPGQAYRHRRLVAVRSLVENTNLSIAECASRSGYENVSSMIRAFRKQFATTPMALRISSRHIGSS